MASYSPGECCTLGVLHEGTPTGNITKVANKWEAYIATPPEGKAHKDVAILFCPDVYGIWQNSKLMADLFAVNGYLTMVIDEFNGDPRTFTDKHKNMDLHQWLNHGTDGDNPHTYPHVDPIIEAALHCLKTEHGAKKIGALGYCFGAKYVCRHYKNGIDAGFVAHPSFVEEDELRSVTGPLSIAAAETDAIFPVEKRHRSEEILRETGVAYQINLFSGVAHGFAVRGDLSKPLWKFAKEQAFLQALSWFNLYLL